MSNASANFWMLLGEARSKCDHIRFSPLAEETAKKLHILYLAKGVGATTAIEGNSLSEAQVQERIEGTLDLPPSKAYLGVEVDNMLAAYHGVLARVRAGERIAINRGALCRLNAQILDNLAVEDHVLPGEFRTVSVVAGAYRAAPAEDVPYLIDRLLRLAGNHPGARRPVALLYAVHGFVDGLTAVIGRLHGQQEQLMWRALLDEAFINQPTAVAHRQRLLAIELGKAEHGQVIRRGDVRRLTAELAEAYATKTGKRSPGT